MKGSVIDVTLLKSQTQHLVCASYAFIRIDSSAVVWSSHVSIETYGFLPS
jgi:hypothetical protein